MVPVPLETFLRFLNGKDFPYSGSIDIGGRIGYLPQYFEDVDGEKLPILILLESLHDRNVDQFHFF